MLCDFKTTHVAMRDCSAQEKKKKKERKNLPTPILVNSVFSKIYRRTMACTGMRGFGKIVHKPDCHSPVSSVSEKMGRPHCILEMRALRERMVFVRGVSSLLVERSSNQFERNSSRAN